MNDHRLFSGKWILNCALPLFILGFIIVIVLIILLIVGINIQNKRKICMGYYSNSSLIIESHNCNEDYVSLFIPVRSYEYIDIGGNCFMYVNEFLVDGLNELKSDHIVLVIMKDYLNCLIFLYYQQSKLKRLKTIH